MLANSLSKYLLLIISLLGYISCQQNTSKSLFKPATPSHIRALSENHFSPKYAPDGHTILFTDPAFNGLTSYAPETKKAKVLTQSINAGSELQFSSDGQSIVYIEHDFSSRKRSSKLILQNIKTGQTKIIVEKARNLKLIKNNEGKIIFFQDGQVKEYDVKKSSLKSGPENIAGVFVDKDLNLLIYNKGEYKILNPGGKGDYLWASVSPDNQRILYSISGKGSFISDLEGDSLIDLGRIHAPKWSPDGKFVLGMNDYDDGQKFTESNIILVSADGKIRHNLTLKTDLIALFPEFSPSGNEIIFNDENGKVYQMKIK